MSSLIDHLGDDWGSLLLPSAVDLPADAAIPAGPEVSAPDPAELIREVLGRMADAAADDPAAPGRSVLEEILASEDHFAPLAYPADELGVGAHAPDPLDGVG